MLGKIEGRRRKAWQGEMVGWHHQLSGHMFEQTLGDSEGQGSHAVLHSMESQRVRHDLATEQQEETKPVGIFIQMNWICSSVLGKYDVYYGGGWRRQWHPTPVLLPGKSHGWRSLVGCSPWGRWELDMTQWLHFHFSLSCIGEGNGNPLQCSYLEKSIQRKLQSNDI